MRPATFTRFEDAYTSVLDHVTRNHEHLNAPRGNASRECLNVSFVLTDPRDRIVYALARRTQHRVLLRRGTVVSVGPR